MATIVLQAAGTALGGFLGPIGAAVGSAIGSLAGYAVDSALLRGTQRVEGARMASARPFAAEEGGAIPRVYGTVRLGGTIIWATRFEEAKTTTRQGGKGASRGASVTEYSYYANVAFALCEGEIAGIRRVWADGRELDQTSIEMRVYADGADQAPDPLIAARQGAGNTPAYRGVAYLVFDRLPLAEYGNRIPQIQVEVLRPVGDLRTKIRAVCLIPGSTEYGLSPSLVTKRPRRGETIPENRHVLHGATDLAASLDELQAICPNIESIALVVSWFGDDLRAGACRIRPAVTNQAAAGYSQAWVVSGVDRNHAGMLSLHDGGSAFGGTPGDRSVMDAIAQIRARGLKVTLYPFVMMDVPHGNALPDPYGGAAQAAYPWRGRITCHPAAGQPGAADKTAAARAQVAAFCGSAEPGDFEPDGHTIAFAGGAGDWGYRRLILHYAHLALAAGGVDAFLIGSELRGLSTIRDAAHAFPFVEALCELAGDVGGLLGPATKLTYGADWTEYFGHHPADGSGDAFFHLDALWAHPAISAVGIDNYMPLSDWRDGDYRTGNPDGASGPYDPAALRRAIAGGEGYDWYYATQADREARTRTPITDGSGGKPWMFRNKDLVGWWSHAHHDRIGGVELPTPTAWVPREKPIWMTEIGCPAVDKGANQPNVFVDAKSSESFTPYFSNGGRNDLAPKRFLEAHAAHWDPESPAFDADANPVSPAYGGRMVDIARAYVWCWDARPFPAFPLRSDVWADGANWRLGHWLNGRLEAPGIGDLVNAILADFGQPDADAGEADGTVQGYAIDDLTSARSAIEPLADLFDLAVCEQADALVVRSAMARSAAPVAIGDMVIDETGVTIEKVRSPDHELPAEVILTFRDHIAEFQAATARSTRQGVSGRRQQTVAFPGVLETEQAKSLVADWHNRIWTARETVSVAVASYRDGIEPGAVITLPKIGSAEFLVTEIEDGLVRRLRGRRIDRASPTAWGPAAGPTPVAPALSAGPPHVLFLDLPTRASSVPAQDHLRVAVWRRPWRRHVVLASPETTGFSARATIATPANLGDLAEPLAACGVTGRLDRASRLVVDLYAAEAAGVSRLQLLGGANVAAVRSQTGAWEVLQFGTAEEIAPDRWLLGDLLRGQLGTDDAMTAGSAAGAPFALLDDRVGPAGLLAGEIGLPLNWRIGPEGADLSEARFASEAATGGLRARLPLSPVHLRCRTAGADLAFSWTRRGRIDADDWAPLDIPLGEEREEYRIDIAMVGGPVVRSAPVPTPTWTYGATEIAADFGVMPAAIDVTVRQLSVAAGFGIPASRRFAL